MPSVYKIYSNDGAGGPIDYATPLATVSGTQYSTAPLSAGGDFRFAVRAQDATTGLVESNTQAVVRIVLDASASDVGPAPAAPFDVAARPTAGGGCLVSWSFLGPGGSAPPSGFAVYLDPGTTAALATPVATVPYAVGRLGYSSPLAGLADGATYTASVVALNGAGARSLPMSVAVVGDSTAPGDVDGLSATAVP